MLAKGRVLALSAVVTVAIVAWGVLVFLAIDRGRGPRDSITDWGILAAYTLGAVVCMFVAILCAARVRDLLTERSDRYDDDVLEASPTPAPGPAASDPVATRSRRALAPEPEPAVDLDEEMDWAEAGRGLIPAQRTRSTPTGSGARSRPPAPVRAAATEPSLMQVAQANVSLSEVAEASAGVAPAPLAAPVSAVAPARPAAPTRSPGSVPPIPSVAANGRGRDDDDPSFVSYAGQGEPTGSDDEPRWANETGEQYYRGLGHRSAPSSTGVQPAARTSDESEGSDPSDWDEDPPSAVSYSTPGKRARR